MWDARLSPTTPPPSVTRNRRNPVAHPAAEVTAVDVEKHAASFFCFVLFVFFLWFSLVYYGLFSLTARVRLGLGIEFVSSSSSRSKKKKREAISMTFFRWVLCSRNLDDGRGEVAGNRSRAGPERHRIGRRRRRILRPAKRRNEAPRESPWNPWNPGRAEFVFRSGAALDRNGGGIDAWRLWHPFGGETGQRKRRDTSITGDVDVGHLWHRVADVPLPARPLSGISDAADSIVVVAYGSLSYRIEHRLESRASLETECLASSIASPESASLLETEGMERLDTSVKARPPL